MEGAFLLPCKCGNEIHVSTAQAGGSVQCSCGEKVSVPTLGELRKLPRTTTDSSPATSTWGPKQGLLAFFLIIAIGNALVGAYYLYQQPTEQELSFASRLEQFSELIPEMTPNEAWNFWSNELRRFGETGLTDEKNVVANRNTMIVTYYKTKQMTFFGISIGALILAIIAAVAMPATPSSKPK